MYSYVLHIYIAMHTYILIYMYIYAHNYACVYMSVLTGAGMLKDIYKYSRNASKTKSDAAAGTEHSSPQSLQLSPAHINSRLDELYQTDAYYYSLYITCSRVYTRYA